MSKKMSFKRKPDQFIQAKIVDSHSILCFVDIQ